MYIPLHVHTAKASIGDSILKIKEYIKKAKEIGLTHAAVTNHGSMADMYEFYYECVNNNIKPIIGCEVYTVNDSTEKIKGEKYNHLVLIAKNQEGLKNLLYITSEANLNGMYYKPRTDLNVMRKHGKGIIALSACLGGEIPQMILALKELTGSELNTALANIRKRITEYKNCFDEFYLELQPGTFEDQLYVNEQLIMLAQQTDTELIITNDVHYLDEEDFFAHDVHVKIERKMNIEEKMIYPDTCYYLMGENELINKTHNIDRRILNSAIKNTVRVANQCHISLEIDTLNMPVFDTPKCYSEDDYLARIALNKLDAKIDSVANPAAYVDRALYELDVLKELGFSGYILSVKDFVDHAKSKNIPVGPGRGSVCGSLIAYLCGITVVDPIKYDLLFERFLSVHRKGSVPDIDLDFASDKRKEMFDYATSKYGKGRCALVSTFGLRKAKASLRDVGRVYNIPLETVDAAAKLIPIAFYDDEGNKSTDLSITDSLKIVPTLREMQSKYPDWFSLAIKLEDLPRVSSIHAAGTIVSPKDLVGHIPLRQKDAESSIFATSLCLSDAEIAGFIKQDFLGLATLTIVGKTQFQVGFEFDADNEELFQEEEVWNLIGSKHTTTLFQIGSRTYKDRMFRLRPRTIEELAACLALVRGPCISSKADQVYMEIVEGKRDIELIHEFYDSATADTNGILLYQEQLMQIAVNFGFSLEESFRLMKAVAKKKIDKIESYEAEFRGYAQENNVPEEATSKVWQIILDAGLYCFNKSHAIAYAILCYQSAYLKIHFPLQYMCNSLTNAYERKEEIEETVAECRRLGMKFKSVDVNDSEWDFTIDKSSLAIRIGLCAIKAFGDKAALALDAYRPYSNFADFMERVPKREVSKRATIPAIFAGLFDSFDTDRLSIYKEFCEIRNEEPAEIIKLSKETFSVGDTYSDIESVILGAPLTSSPVNDFEPIGFGDLRKNAVFNIRAVVTKVKKLKDKNQNLMAFLTLETGDGLIDGTVFSTNYKEYRKLYKKGLIVNIKAKKDKEGSCVILSME